MKLKNYNVWLVVWHYACNWRLHIWLIDLDDGCPFADITENHVEISDRDLEIEWYGIKVILDNDFISVFDNDIRQAKIWCMDNLKCLWWDTVDWRPCLFLTKEMIQHLYDIAVINEDIETVWNYEVNTPDWDIVEWIVTHDEWDWRNVNTFKVYHKTDAYETELHSEQIVDNDFDEDYLLDVVEDLATRVLHPEDK